MIKNIADLMSQDMESGDYKPHVGIVRDYKPVRYDMGGFEESVHPEVFAMHREAQWFVNDVLNKQRPRRWLSLLGASGVGKTHLGKAIIDVLKKELKHLLVQWWPWQEVVTMYRNGEYGIVEHLVHNPHVLLLDDIGAENITNPVRAMLTRIADGRLEKWTIWTSNLLSDHIGTEIDVRIASRMYRGDNVVCEVEKAPDYCYERKRRKLS